MTWLDPSTSCARTISRYSTVAGFPYHDISGLKATMEDMGIAVAVLSQNSQQVHVPQGHLLISAMSSLKRGPRLNVKPGLYLPGDYSPTLLPQP